jgi:magnesium-transporting ATPase (P-type)
MESFERLAPLQTRVLRGGEVSSVEARQLVQGDTALVSGGDKVPADLQILEAASPKVSIYTSGP